MKTLVVGATGLVGRELVRQLEARPEVDEVRVVVRRPVPEVSEKVHSWVVDFEALEGAVDAFAGVDSLYSALGTTLKTAGSREAQRRIDFDYQLEVARLGVRAGANAFVLVSAMGADPKSLLFYSRMKGELEEAIRSLGYRKLLILRPGILDGERQESRPGERFALRTLRLLPSLEAFAGVRPIPAITVARAAVRAANDFGPGVHVLEARELFRWGAADADV